MLVPMAKLVPRAKLIPTAPLPRVAANGSTASTMRVALAGKKKSERAGNERFILCTCGWLVHLNTACKAQKQRYHRHTTADRLDARLACTNYVCTGIASHQRYRKRYRTRQMVQGDAVRDGTALLVHSACGHRVRA